MPVRKIRSINSFEKCRTCDHSFISHTDYKKQPCSCQNIVQGICKCKEFFSKDNLEFLEQKYAKIK